MDPRPSSGNAGTEAANVECSQGSALWQENVLTLDGGGIRGYVSLRIMEALMAEVGIREQKEDAQLRNILGHGSYDSEQDPLTTRAPLPCHYFDYIVGTSTGGLIAIMFGRLRMTVHHCLSEYKKLGYRIFRKSRLLHYYRYSHRKLQSSIRDVVMSYCEDTGSTGRGDDMMYQKDADGQGCRTAVLAVEKRKRQKDQLHAFTSYFPSPDHEQIPPPGLSPHNPKQVYIRDAGRATSAAPGFFQEADVNGQVYMDGAMMANNPSRWAWDEAFERHPGRRRAQQTAANGSNATEENSGTPEEPGNGCPIGVFVSIGTGLRAPQSAFHRGDPLRSLRALLRKAVSNMTDCEKVHEDMEKLAGQHNHRLYYRFNPPGLEDMRLDQCLSKGRTFERMDTACHEYLNGSEVKRQIRECAAELVKRRRSRCSQEELLKFHNLTRRGPRGW